MRKYFLLPTFKQYKSWSLPSKATLVSLWVGTIALILTIYTLFFPLSKAVKRFNSINDMRMNLEGFNSEYLDLVSKYEGLVEDKRKSYGGDFGTWPLTFDILLLGENNYGVDLNEDGVPEIQVYVGFDCMGTGGCFSSIYSFNLDSKKLVRIAGVNIRNYYVSDVKIDGWFVLHDFWRLGACEELKSTYSFRGGEYIVESKETINHCP